MKSLKQRSSILSSLVTGLVGWIGLIVISPMIFGVPFNVKEVIIIGIVGAFVQVGFLRLFFKSLFMHLHLLFGLFWGLVTAIAMYYGVAYIFPEYADNQLYWVLTYAYIGAPIGAFLSYFHIDDAKIENDADADEIDYGRDAHWLEPFAFGAAGYLIAFNPFYDFDLAIMVFIVGAISGVAAAGLSHFSPDKLKYNYISLFLIIVGLGLGHGYLTSLLFRNIEVEFINLLTSALIGGVITFAVTFLRGRQLAIKEEGLVL